MTNEFADMLRAVARKNQSLVCMGVDPNIEKIRQGLQQEKMATNNVAEDIEKFFNEILKRTSSKIGAVKPNYAFFAQYGLDGLSALKNIISTSKNLGLFVILDAKRGDIGKTSDAYAKEVFDVWGADAVTVHPYMGYDSVIPFAKQNRGAYILTRTSNPGARDLQDLELKSGGKVFDAVSELVINWNKTSDGYVGGVLGATYPEELVQINSRFSKSGQVIPLLIPGVGSQGGNTTRVVKILMNQQKDILIHRISSSSGIIYNFLKTGKSFIESAESAVDELNAEISQAGFVI